MKQIQQYASFVFAFKALRKIFRSIFCRAPLGVVTGRRVVVHRPRKFQGRPFIELGEGVHIAAGAWLAANSRYYDFCYKPQLKIGKGTQIGRNCMISCIDQLEVGQNCLFSERIFISDHAHGVTPGAGPLPRQALWSKGRTKIGDNCFLGYSAVVLPGVELGNNCVVGANSVVTRSFPPFSMVGGVPARLLKTYVPETGEWRGVK